MCVRRFVASGQPTIARASRIAFALLVAMIAHSPDAAAQLGPGFGLSAGVLDFEDGPEVLELGFEYRLAPWKLGLEPHLGLGVTSERDAFAYFGLWRAFSISTRWRITPSFAVALYRQGDGSDLGHPIEFRSGLVISRTLSSGAEFGLGVYHLSNGGLGDTNPGANSLLLRYFFPRRSR
jgi:hypothetical protein